MKRSVEGSNDLMKEFPPIQLDHSTAAVDTVGRLVGKVELGPYIRKDGKQVLGLYGYCNVLGAENVEKVEDGRWTHLSVGVDFKRGIFAELTITPFPAAGEASFLSRLKGDKMGKKLSAEEKERFKKHLTARKKMSEEDAEKHLARCEEEDGEFDKMSAEAEEDDKKEKQERERLSADEKEKEEKEEKLKKLTSAKAEITRLGANFKKSSDTARLAAAKSKIIVRLSTLRAQAKVTPAEIKKMDIEKLSTEPQSTIDAVLKTYEDREPVIMTGQLGSVKADDLANLGKEMRVSRLEQETRANMSMLKKTATAPDKLGAAPVQQSAAAQVVVPFEAEKAHSEIVHLMDGGKISEAKERLKSFMTSYSALSSSASGSEDAEKQISALADSCKTMQSDFAELEKLAGSLVELN
jgi:hypothetical protein